MQSPVLYILIGYPGAGKTTTAMAVQRVTGAIHIWTDKERQRRFSTVTHSAAESKLLYDALNREVKEHLQAGKSVIFDTNFNHRSDRQHMKHIAVSANATLVTLWVQTEASLARERATRKSAANPSRVFGNMDEVIFDGIVSRLEPPTAGERYIVVDGTRVRDDYIARLLSKAS